MSWCAALNNDLQPAQCVEHRIDQAENFIVFYVLSVSSSQPVSNKLSLFFRATARSSAQQCHKLATLTKNPTCKLQCMLQGHVRMTWSRKTESVGAQKTPHVAKSDKSAALTADLTATQTFCAVLETHRMGSVHPVELKDKNPASVSLCICFRRK